MIRNKRANLFIDIWKKYGSPDEVDDADIIFNILNDLVL